MRKYTFIALIAGSLFVEGARTVVVIRARLAFVALSFEEVLAEQFGVSDCLAARRRGTPIPVFAAFAAP